MRAGVVTELLLSALLALALLVLRSPAEPVADVVSALELVPDSSGQAANNTAPILDGLLHSFSVLLRRVFSISNKRLFRFFVLSTTA